MSFLEQIRSYITSVWRRMRQDRVSWDIEMPVGNSGSSKAIINLKRDHTLNLFGGKLMRYDREKTPTTTYQVVRADGSTVSRSLAPREQVTDHGRQVTVTVVRSDVRFVDIAQGSVTIRNL